VPYRVLIRHGPKVERREFATLDDALELIEARCRALTAQPRPRAVKVARRTFEPGQQVTGRAELRGPGGMLAPLQAGVDVRGDGSVEAWTGRVRRRPVTREQSESAYDALRRVLSSTSVEP
jgi:hypothetical protein